MKENDPPQDPIEALCDDLMKDKLCIKFRLGEGCRPVCVICKKPFHLDEGLGLFFELSDEAVCVECVTKDHDFLKGSSMGRLGEAMLCWRNRQKQTAAAD